VLAALADADRPRSTAALEPRVNLSRSRLDMVLKVLDVDGAVRRVRGGWESTGQPWQYDADRYQRIAQARTAEQQAMLDYIGTSDCRMEFLLRELDDTHAGPCGRCDNCTGRHWPTTVSPEASDAAGERLGQPGVEVTPRRQWPSGMAELDVPLSGKIGASELAEEGRAVARLTDIGWGDRLREILAEDRADGPVPDDVFKACIQVLAGWAWTQRPTGVVTLPSARRPQLVASLGERLATVGRLKGLGALDGVTSGERANSAQRLAALWSTLQVPADLAAELSTTDGPVLVVCDHVDTGWTMTLATRLLRAAGAPSVLPFALATT
jgi:ATP-dependent DNA helicase RecQ